MATLAQVEEYGSKVVANIQALVSCISHGNSLDTNLHPSDNSGESLLPAHVSEEAQHARRSILSHISQLQILLEEPVDFLQRLVKHNQLLSCLRWLSEHQVLACIPLEGSVPISDVAALLGVPESQLTRVALMMVTAGFLCQPHPDQLAHTSLSAALVDNPNLMDAALFFSETAAPAASNAVAATRRWGLSSKDNETAYNVAFDTPNTLANACNHQPRLRRQWPAYLRYGMGDVEAGVTDVLTQLDWGGLGAATVVDSSATSIVMATRLAGLYPMLRFIVQMSNTLGPIDSTTTTPANRIVVQQRESGTPQQVRDAALFIIRLPIVHASKASQVRAELYAHIGVLCTNPRARLLLVLPSVLQEPGGTGRPEIEAIARMRDLTLWQLANEGELEMQGLIELLNGVQDGQGRLVVVNKFTAPHHPAVALEIRYQTYAEVELSIG